MTPSVTDVVLSPTVASVYFLTVGNWYEAPIITLASVFWWSRGLFGLILAALLRKIYLIHL